MEEVLIDIKPIIENNSNIAYILPSWANKSNKINNPYSIDIWKEGITIKSFSLSVKSFFIIGRNKSLCDITLTNPTISRTHCVLQYRNNESLFIYDLNSVYGTFINGEKINPLKYYQLKSGDIFKLGNSKKMFILNRESDDIKNEEENNFKFHINDEIRKLLNEKKKDENKVLFINESNWGIDDYDKEIQEYQKNEDNNNEIDNDNLTLIKSRKNLNDNQKNLINKIENLKEQMEKLIKQRKNIKYEKEENPLNKSEQNKLENKNVYLLKKIMEIKEKIIKLENTLKESIRIIEEKNLKFDKKKYIYYNEDDEFFDETEKNNNINNDIDTYDTVKLRIEKLLIEKQKLMDKKKEIEKNQKLNIKKDSLDEFYDNLNNNNEISIEEQIKNINKKINQEESLLKFVSPINLKIGNNEKRDSFKEEIININSKNNQNLNKHSIAKFIDSFQKQQEINYQKEKEEIKLFHQKELEELQKPLNSNITIDEDMKIKLEQYERDLNGDNKIKKEKENNIKENGEKSLFKEIIKNIGNDNFDINKYSKIENVKKKEKKNKQNEFNLPNEEEYLSDLIQKKRNRNNNNTEKQNYNMSLEKYNEILFENDENLEELHNKTKYKEENISGNPFQKYLKNDE